jgi:hypothetical protein
MQWLHKPLRDGVDHRKSTHFTSRFIFEPQFTQTLTTNIMFRSESKGLLKPIEESGVLRHPQPVF